MRLRHVPQASFQRCRCPEVDGYTAGSSLKPTAPATNFTCLQSHDQQLVRLGMLAADTDGQLQLGPGTLYGCLKRMLTAPPLLSHHRLRRADTESRGATAGDIRHSGAHETAAHQEFRRPAVPSASPGRAMPRYVPPASSVPGGYRSSLRHSLGSRSGIRRSSVPRWRCSTSASALLSRRSCWRRCFFVTGACRS